MDPCLMECQGSLVDVLVLAILSITERITHREDNIAGVALLVWTFRMWLG